MRRQTKRALTLLLALALCLGLLPMAAMASETSKGDLEHVEVITDTTGVNAGGGDLEHVEVITDVTGSKTNGEFTITFDANGGKFSNGNSTQEILTWPEGFITVAPKTPTREGYTFVNWSGMSYDELKYHKFTSDTTVTANWEKDEEPSNKTFNLDPNGGTVDPNYFTVEGEWGALKIVGKLPTPTRPGYIFKGWYIDGKLVDESKPITSTAPFPVAQWEKDGSEEQKPEREYAGEVWFYLEGGTVVSVGGVKPNDYGSVVLPGGEGFDQRPDEGEEILGVMLTDRNGKLPALPVMEKEGYTFDGWYTMKTGGNKVTTDTAFAPNGKYGRAYVWARWSEGGSKDGPFTVKFDLNYKQAKASETPKEQKVSKGSTVSLPDGGKLTPPYSNYKFSAWCLKDSDGKLYPWNEQQAVTADMTLYAEWVPKDGAAKPETPAQPSAPAKTAFADVAASSPFAPAISWAVEKGITNGKTATTFAPGDPCTRAQIVTFLWRAAGSPEPKTMEGEYADVTNTAAYYYKAIQWAAEMGMEESGTFKPGDPCTRGQAMYFIWKARAGASSAGSAPSFTDLDKGSAYYDAVLWAVGQGVTKGKTETTFGPDDPCTRGQIVTFLYRAYAK